MNSSHFSLQTMNICLYLIVALIGKSNPDCTACRDIWWKPQTRILIFKNESFSLIIILNYLSAGMLIRTNMAVCFTFLCLNSLICALLGTSQWLALICVLLGISQGIYLICALLGTSQWLALICVLLGTSQGIYLICALLGTSQWLALICVLLGINQ